MQKTCQNSSPNSHVIPLPDSPLPRNVAVKMLQPIDPGGNARESTLAAYRAGKSKWERDPLQYACKAYCTARQGREGRCSVLS